MKRIQQLFNILQQSMSEAGREHYRQKNSDRYSQDRDKNSNKKSKKQKKHKHDRYDRSESRSESKQKRRDNYPEKNQNRASRSRSKDRHKRKRQYERDDRNDRQRGRDRDRDRYDNRDRRGNKYDRRRSSSYDRKGGRDKDRKHEAEKPEKDPYFEQRKQIQRVRKTDPKKADQLQKQLDKKIILDEKSRQYEIMKEKFQQAQKQMEQAKREDHTIIVYCLPLKAKEKHIWRFFYDSGCGKVRDIRIIKDARSGRSKGVAYVEFYTSESVERALLMAEKPFQLNGRYFTSLKVQHSQAEKNRAAAAAKQLKLTKPVDPNQQAYETQKRQMKVMVGGLNDKLAQIQESQLKQLFEPFGSIDYVDIHRDAMTGKCKGFAFIQYSSTDDAKNAVREMNNLKIGDQRITVQTVSTAQKNNLTAGEDYLYSAGNKTALMNKLSRDAPSHSNLMRPPISTMSTPYLVLSNMFKMEGSDPKFFEDLKKEVLATCSNFGIVEKCFIEKNNQGNIWVKFSDTQSAVKAQEKISSQFFDGVKIFCYFVTEQVYQSRIGV